MPAHVIFDVEIRDPAGYRDFMSQVQPAPQAIGAGYLARGGAHKVHEGDRPPRRLVISRFPSIAVRVGVEGREA